MYICIHISICTHTHIRHSMSNGKTIDGHHGYNAITGDLI